jgi:Tol biopolymer transport system component
MRRASRLLVALALAALATATASPAGAMPPGPNGQIAFSRPDPATGEPRIFIANPDGTHERQLPLPLPGDGPVWAPDGNKLLVAVFRPEASVRPATVNADGSDSRVLDVPQLPPDMDMGCRAWSPDATRLLCQAIRFGGDPSLNGIYTIRASDGGGLRRLTVNPYPPRGDFGGGDIPGDFSPDGSRFVFMRAKPGAGPVPDRNQTGALFVANTDGTGLRQLTPYGLANSHDNGLAHWSPDGSGILFASAQGSLFTVRPDGADLRAIPLNTGGGFSYAFTPGWSPDGTRIVFSLFLETTEQVDIYTARPDGSQVAQVTDTSDFEDLADWGPSPLAA